MVSRLPLTMALLLLPALGCSGAGTATPGDVITTVDVLDADASVEVDAAGDTLVLRCPGPVDAFHEPVTVLESDRVFWDYLLSRIDPPAMPTGAEAFPAWQGETREALVHALGFDGIEEPGTFVDSRVLGILDHGDHVIEKVLVEAHPGLWVTTLVMHPPSPATSLPGILVHHGHDQPGKSREPILTLGINLARRGALVVQPDWVFFGDLTTPENDHMHTEGNLLAGRSMNLPITSIARRMLDYLDQRPEVDPARLGMTGHSGGAETTFYVSAVEPRIRAAAPIDGLDDWSFRVGYRLFRDPEHFPIALLTFAGYQEVLALAAPRWFFALTGDEDYIAGPSHVVADVVAAAAPAWQLTGHPERIRHQGFPGGHQVSRAKREAVYEFFASALDTPGLAGPEDGVLFGDEAALHMKPPAENGSVLDTVRQLQDEALEALDVPTAEGVSLILGTPGEGAGTLELLPGDSFPRVGRVRRDEGPDLPVDLYLPSGWNGNRGLLCISGDGRRG
ncbi:MAG: hypothetical protein FJ098_02590, partial [Deltaproteobacteria bacterium]|nr:hypothetical protein [Deltaproteobacteria bacterium]